MSLTKEAGKPSGTVVSLLRMKLIFVRFFKFLNIVPVSFSPLPVTNRELRERGKLLGSCRSRTKLFEIHTFFTVGGAWRNTWSPKSAREDCLSSKVRSMPGHFIRLCENLLWKECKGNRMRDRMETRSGRHAGNCEAASPFRKILVTLSVVLTLQVVVLFGLLTKYVGDVGKDKENFRHESATIIKLMQHTKAQT